MFDPDVHERYQKDAVFANLVNNIEAMLRSGTTTPSELRQALIYALTRMEIYEAKPMFIPKGQNA